jgi:hypothetical protein
VSEFQSITLHVSSKSGGKLLLKSDFASAGLFFEHRWQAIPLPPPLGGYFASKSIGYNGLAGLGAAKILHIKYLRAKYLFCLGYGMPDLFRA